MHDESTTQVFVSGAAALCRRFCSVTDVAAGKDNCGRGYEDVDDNGI